MKTYVDKSQENKSQSVANNFSQKQGGKALTFQFVDNRSEAVTQRKLQEMANTHVISMSSPIQTKSNRAIQRVTSIKYDTTEFDMENGKKEIVGKEMEATLDPNDKIRGSAPGNGVQALLMNTLKFNGYKRMVRGHLLNGQLGGLGIAANLFPITTQANAKHKNHVENPIKDQITKGKEIKYSVTVASQNKMSNPTAAFVCNARATDATWSRNETINSNPGQTSTRGGNVEGSTTGGTESMPFATKNLPSGWGEKNRGLNNSAEHQNTLSKSRFLLDGSNVDVDGTYAYGYHFDSGVIDRQEYANELIGKYNGDPTNKWPIYFDKNPYTSQELEDLIDTSNSSDVERIISRIEGLL